MHPFNELGHLLLQFLYAFFVNGVCWIGNSRMNGMNALELWLCDWSGDCFRSNLLMKLGQNLVDMWSGERDIPSDLQRKFKDILKRYLHIRLKLKLNIILLGMEMFWVYYLIVLNFANQMFKTELNFL